MTTKFIAYIFMAGAALVLVLALGTLVALLRSFMVSSTLAAVESAFGSFVLLIILLVAARKLFDAGQRRMKSLE